jgi:ABC-type antimicrobial peptide transport system permease subunit
MGGKDFQVVGLVNDIKEMGLDKPAAPTIYIPMAQVPDSLTAAMNRWFLTSWLARTSGAQDLSAALREAVAQVDPQMPIARIRPMTEVLGNSISSQRFVLSLMAIFAGLAVVLTSIGIYGVLSYQVAERTREIGIRMALGASSGNVLRLVIKDGMTFVAIGVVVGLGLAYALTRLMESWLYNVSATDFATFAGISIMLSLVALAACAAPARRASRVDPMVALRYE